MGKNIFEQGEFNSYRVDSLSHSMKPIHESYDFAQKKTSVFISHKHDDLNDLKGVIGFLETEYNVDAYIDSRDPSMPETTSGETADRIKDRIKSCDKFILIATNGAIESKWCNWELGYGDAQKYQKHIALFPMKPSGEYDSSYKGNEYMQIYPYIVKRKSGDTYSDGTPIEPGYYVRYKDGSSFRITELSEWLQRR